MVNNENFFSKEFAWLTYSYRSFFFNFLRDHIDFHYHLLPNYHLYTARSLYTHVWTQDTFSINHFVRVWKSAENIFFANDILAYGIASYFSQYRSPYFTLYSFLFSSVRPSCCRTICFCFFVTSKESSCPCSSIYLDQTSKPVFYFWANPTLCFLPTNPTLLFWMASPSRASPLRWYPSSLTTFSQYFPLSRDSVLAIESTWNFVSLSSCLWSRKSLVGGMYTWPCEYVRVRPRLRKRVCKVNVG